MRDKICLPALFAPGNTKRSGFQKFQVFKINRIKINADRYFIAAAIKHRMNGSNFGGPEHLRHLGNRQRPSRAELGIYPLG